MKKPSAAVLALSILLSSCVTPVTPCPTLPPALTLPTLTQEEADTLDRIVPDNLKEKIVTRDVMQQERIKTYREAFSGLCP